MEVQVVLMGFALSQDARSQLQAVTGSVLLYYKMVARQPGCCSWCQLTGSESLCRGNTLCIAAKQSKQVLLWPALSITGRRLRWRPVTACPCSAWS